jgi:hypothetical protein
VNLQLFLGALNGLRNWPKKAEVTILGAFSLLLSFGTQKKRRKIKIKRKNPGFGESLLKRGVIKESD